MARRTFSNYKAAIVHALGSNPATGETAGELANDALQQLCHMHPWNWNRGGPVSLDLTTGQDYIELPQDFGVVESVTYPGTIARQMIPTTISDIQRMRSYLVMPPSFMFYYAVNSGQTEEDFITRTGGTPNPADPTQGLSINVLEIYPTPTNTVTDAISLVYRRSIDRMELDADIPAIPPWMDYALDLLCRSLAVTLEDDNPQNAAQVMFDKILPDLKKRDAGVQRRIGPMKGGLYPRTIPIDPMYPSSIGNPTAAS